LKATEQPIDTSTAAGKAFLDMLGVFAEFETNLRRERQLEGIAAGQGPARCHRQGSQVLPDGGLWGAGRENFVGSLGKPDCERV